MNPDKEQSHDARATRRKWRALSITAVVLVTIASSIPVTTQNRGLTAPSSASSTGRLTLDVGLTIVTTVMGEQQGDFESIKQIVAASPETVQFTYTGDVRPGSGNQRLQLQRTQSRQDLRHARDLNTRFAASQPTLITGATTLGVSSDVLDELRSKGVAAIGHIVGEGGNDVKYAVTLRRVEPGTVPYSTIVNGSAWRLPAIHAKSSPNDDDQVEFYLLDDPGNPMWLSWQAKIRNGTPFGARVIKIEDSSAGLRARVCEDMRVPVYGIYFDFNSDSVRAESDPVLRTVAEALTAKPACRLMIEGHTDNVGGAEFNLDLSKRRAEAVKRSLVDHFRIGPDRLATAGYGLTKPKAPSDSAEGRAQNRRVELVRR